MDRKPLILVTAAGGRVGATGRYLSLELLRRGFPVRAWVHTEDHRSAMLANAGAEIFAGDMLSMHEIRRAMDGVGRVYFACPVIPRYLECCTAFVAAARDEAVDCFVDVSQQSAREDTESPQTFQNWLSEQMIAWSGVPFVHLAPGPFCEQVARAFRYWIVKADQVAMPWGMGRIALIAGSDVARVAAAVLADPAPHIGRRYPLNGAQLMTPAEIAEVFSEALRRPIRYVDVPPEAWREGLRAAGLSDYLVAHLSAVANRNRQRFYEQTTNLVEELTGTAPTTLHDFVVEHAVELQSEDARPRLRQMTG